MRDLAMLATLVLFAFVVSQPFFYWLALGRASATLSGPAYVELRQRINAAMNTRLPWLYGASLVSALASFGVAVADGATLPAVAILIAVAGLVADAVLAVRHNVPINTLMDAWTPSEPPADWHVHRARWTAAFATRQRVLSVAFASLLLGAVVGR